LQRSIDIARSEINCSIRKREREIVRRSGLLTRELVSLYGDVAGNSRANALKRVSAVSRFPLVPRDEKKVTARADVKGGI
jgi:hypothetical protein